MTRYDAYRALMRMDKPIGTWLLLWPTFWALLVAGSGDPSVRLVAVFAAGVFSYAFSGLCDQRLRRSQARRAC